MSIIVWITVVALAALGYILIAYNSLVRMRNQVKESWSDIDIQLKRRHNLIPNVVETVKGYASHESKTFQSVTEARTKAVQAGTPAEQAKAENMLTSTLKTLFAVSEQYPDLKANANFLELQRELSDTENKIQAARRLYNTTVREFNTAIESVPTNIVANIFSFKAAEYFELEAEAERSVPSVSFGNK